MGKIWVQRSDGRVIHLPIVEDDFNTPDDPIVLPPVLAVNRCYNQQIQVVHPTLGTITFDFMPPGLTGSCNQCGHCCSHLVEDCPHPTGDCGWPYNADIDAHACQYLTVLKKNKWPQAGNTECSLYADILNTFKGCAYPPDVIDPLWINCGYSF